MIELIAAAQMSDGITWPEAFAILFAFVGIACIIAAFFWGLSKL